MLELKTDYCHERVSQRPIHRNSGTQIMSRCPQELVSDTEVPSVIDLIFDSGSALITERDIRREPKEAGAIAGPHTIDATNTPANIRSESAKLRQSVGQVHHHWNFIKIETSTFHKQRVLFERAGDKPKVQIQGEAASQINSTADVEPEARIK